MKRLLLTSIGAASFAIAILLAWEAAFTLGNYLFEWSPDKISAEWPLSLRVAATQAAIGLGAAAVASALLKRLMRMAFWGLFAAALCVASIFVMIGMARHEAAYLWLVLGIPMVLSYVAARTWSHLRAHSVA